MLSHTATYLTTCLSQRVICPGLWINRHVVYVSVNPKVPSTQAQVFEPVISDNIGH